MKGHAGSVAARRRCAVTQAVRRVSRNADNNTTPCAALVARNAAVGLRRKRMARRRAGVAWTIAIVVLVSAVLGACALAGDRDDAGAKPPADGVTYLVQVPGAG